MNEQQKVHPPKPLTCTIEGTVATVTWNLVELRKYLNKTDDQILWVTNDEGTAQSPIRVACLREQYAAR